MQKPLPSDEDGIVVEEDAALRESVVRSSPLSVGFHFRR